MRFALIAATAVGLCACSMPGGNYNLPPKVSYGYGLGDNAKPDGAKPNYSFANGLSNDVPMHPTQAAPNVTMGYGADGLTSDSVALVPQPQQGSQQLAAPATGHPAANANHS